MKKAVLFDIDGTLLDAYDFVFDSVKNNIAVFKLPPKTDKKIKEAIGKSLAEFYDTLFPGVDPSLLAKTHQQFQENYFYTLKPFPKAKKTLGKLKDQGILLAAVSNRTRDSLCHSLKTTKIFDYFDVIVCADDVSNPKPHQEHLLVALEQLRMEPEGAYMVGDMGQDILAGKNAGVKTVGVTYGFLGKDIAKHEPDYVINDIKELLQIIK